MIFSNIIVLLICILLIIYSTIITIDTFEKTNKHVTSSDEFLEIANNSNVPAETTPETTDGNSYVKPCEMPTNSDETTSDSQKAMYCKNIQSSEKALNSQKYMEESNKVTSSITKKMATSHAITNVMGSSKDFDLVEALRKQVKGLKIKVDELEKKNVNNN